MVLNAWNFQPRKQLLRLTSAVHLTLLSWNIEQGRRMWTAPLGALPETLFVPHSFSLLPFPLVFSFFFFQLLVWRVGRWGVSPPRARSQKRDKATRINQILCFTSRLFLCPCRSFKCRPLTDDIIVKHTTGSWLIPPRWWRSQSQQHLKTKWSEVFFQRQRSFLIQCGVQLCNKVSNFRQMSSKPMCVCVCVVC